VHILNVRQSAFAKDIQIVNHNAVGMPPSHAATTDGEGDGSIVLRPGSRAKVRFEFAKRPVRLFSARFVACSIFMESNVTSETSGIAGVHSSRYAHALSGWSGQGCGNHYSHSCAAGRSKGMRLFCNANS
jgi:hypothetical protein